MIMSALTLEALEVLDSIARRGSYAAAAAELGKVPSALSYTVQKLEDELELRLFRRQGRRSVLTPAGEALAEGGARLLKDSEELIDYVTRIATGWEPRLTVAIDATVDRSLLWPAINRLYAEHPSLELSLEEQVLGGTWESLFDDRADLIVGAITNVPDQYTQARQGVRVHPWHPVEMVFVAAPDHPISRLSEPISRATIEAQRAIVVSDTAQRLGALSRGSFQRGRAIYVDNMSEKRDAHVAGLGVGWLPRFLAQPEIDRGRLKALSTDDNRTSEPTALAYRSSNRGRGLKLLAESLLETAND